MNARARARRAIGAVTATGISVLVLAGVVWASPLYCGSGRGPTPEYAIKKAIYDARISAEGDGLFNCTVAGEPIVWFVQNDPYPGFYRAGVNMTCS